MKITYSSWIRTVPAVLGCMLIAASAVAQDNAPLPENGVAPGSMSEFAAPQLLNPDVFYNMYPNTYSGMTSAQMYVAPLPVPSNVGHTYYTYQPLMPHEYLYAHKRVYYTPYGMPSDFYRSGQCGENVNCGYGVNKTTVTWYSGAYHFGTAPFGVFPMENLRRFRDHCRGAGCGVNGCNSCR